MTFHSYWNGFIGIQHAENRTVADIVAWRRSRGRNMKLMRPPSVTILPPTNGKVIFLLVFVCSQGKHGVPHVTITYDALYLSVQSPPTLPPPLDIRQRIYPPPALSPWTSYMDPCRFPLDIRHGTTLTLPPASDIWWASLETCSNLLPWGPLSPPHPLVLTSGSRCSYCWQAGGTHPIGMLSCITYFYRAGGGGPAWSLAPQPRGLSNVVMKTEPLSPKHLNFLQDTARRSSIKS